MFVSSYLPVNPTRAYVLGCGKFGTLASLKIKHKWPDCEIHIVDKMTEFPSEILGIQHNGTDAIQFLRDNLHRDKPDELVIPCIPEHLVFNWVLSHIGYTIPVPVRLMELLPGAIVGKDGCFYCSLSDFLCPSTCSEPEGYCPVTKRKRLEPLFRTFEHIELHSYKTTVVQSGQLLPGVGALTAKQLFSLIDSVRKRKGRLKNHEHNGGKS